MKWNLPAENFLFCSFLFLSVTFSGKIFLSWKTAFSTSTGQMLNYALRESLRNKNINLNLEKLVKSPFSCPIKSFKQLDLTSSKI